ncbi:MAG TPA: 50S ribosomal protein L17 [Nitrospinaceae bacterium]|jgi:large subunit ribosomal protein L17|nr:50S ribosomal protein L17 [Nitrospinaceae bacterium]HIL26742.1 50S ribosomal protein L17 [Nitrospinaceae bacterium]
MRHLKAGRKLNRTSAHRKALFRNMVSALIDNERIRTTLAKAKELRGKVERTITLGKKGTLHARRHALKLVADRDSLRKIFGSLAERYANRPGGYTRVIKLGHRLGDDAPMAFIELVDREVDSSVKEKKKEAGENKKERKNEKAPSKKPVVKATAKKPKDEKKKIEKTDSKKTTKDKEKDEEKNKKPAKDNSSKKK